MFFVGCHIGSNSSPVGLPVCILYLELFVLDFKISLFALKSVIRCWKRFSFTIHFRIRGAFRGERGLCCSMEAMK